MPLRWDDKAQTLTIGARQGSYAGMPATRSISVRFHVPGKAEAPDMADNPATTVTYSGVQLAINLSR